jgi:signal transduction histidine kinase
MEILERLDDEYIDLIALADGDEAMREVVRTVPQRVGVDAAFVGKPSANDTLILSNLTGFRTSAMQDLVVGPGKGLAGRVTALRRPVWVSDYLAASLITHDYDEAVSIEGLHGMIAVPIVVRDRIRGILYGACRREVTFGDQAADVMLDAANKTAAAIMAAERARHAAEVAVHEERQRLALALHDSVGAMLFAISAGARDVGSTSLPASVQARLTDIERQAEAAAAALREALRALSASPEQLALTVALRADCRNFQERTGIHARLVAMDELPALDPVRTRALVDTAREALLNVEKHAHAHSVVVTAYTTDDGIALAVADDGSGLDESRATNDGLGLGIAAAHDRLSRLGGRLSLVTNDDGGVTMKSWVPL